MLIEFFKTFACFEKCTYNPSAKYFETRLQQYWLELGFWTTQCCFEIDGYKKIILKLENAKKTLEHKALENGEIY